MTKYIFAVLFGILFSQFPNFALQYVQRLGGAAEELRTIIIDFDRSANASGLTRDEALASMEGNLFLQNHQGDMRRSLARGEKIIADYLALEPRSDLARVLAFHRFRDTKIMTDTAKDFRPAIPLTLTGLMFTTAGMGFGFFFGIFVGKLFRRKGSHDVQTA